MVGHRGRSVPLRGHVEKKGPAKVGVSRDQGHRQLPVPVSGARFSRDCAYLAVVTE